jgi:hypothetical protein
MVVQSSLCSSGTGDWSHFLVKVEENKTKPEVEKLLLWVECACSMVVSRHLTEKMGKSGEQGVVQTDDKSFPHRFYHIASFSISIHQQREREGGTMNLTAYREGCPN